MWSFIVTEDVKNKNNKKKTPLVLFNLRGNAVINIVYLKIVYNIIWAQFYLPANCKLWRKEK